jgi:hypothetical protein
MGRCFFELRAKSLTQATLLASDLMHHLHSRQYLGKALVVCENPFSTLRVSRKQWLKLARTIQRERASTLNADKILKFTYAITHMQRMQFTAKPPEQCPGAQLYFADANTDIALPPQCTTLYIAAHLSQEKIAALVKQLPDSALIVDYANKTRLDSLQLAPKHELEEKVATAWQEVEAFLHAQEIQITSLVHNHLVTADLMDDTLDTLLSASSDFLRVASNFQQAFELAQPLRISKATGQLYNTLTLLAYRVQALSPGSYSQHMMRTYHENETYFLHDIAVDLVPEGESLLETISRHKQAGRTRLAMAILSSLGRLHLGDSDATSSLDML